MNAILEDASAIHSGLAFRGSRAQCLALTSAARAKVADRLTALAAPLARIDPERDQWMPEGFSAPAEAKLGEAPGFLPAEQRGQLTEWWLAKAQNANTPNWDIASTAEIGGRRGLLLVEAKAHVSELSTQGKFSVGHQGNHSRIEDAIVSANAGLSESLPGWRLSRDHNYQLANRFAWSWKLATMGVPVVLVYLGFLGTEDVSDSAPLSLMRGPGIGW